MNTETNIDLNQIAENLYDYARLLTKQAREHDYDSVNRWQGMAEAHQVKANYYEVRSAWYETLSWGEVDAKLSKLDAQKEIIQRDDFIAKIAEYENS
jgi:hypothetical protein